MNRDEALLELVGLIGKQATQIDWLIESLSSLAGSVETMVGEQTLQEARISMLEADIERLKQ